MLNWIPEWHLNLMRRCWSDDPSGLDDDVMRQLEIADENNEHTSNSQKQELLELFSHKLYPQSCYIRRSTHTLHGFVLGDISVCDKGDVGDDKDIGDCDDGICGILGNISTCEGDDGISNSHFYF
ncbi:hypothetical protein Glove_155g71 [Diversispora epigaea]|uniref:Uncharacterized protein n=1 Tax=Diversispora epigaea TaxID=1348612 RepID=A0A397IS86_9GLOM|nr:hypothetical protein Glove_155g71 [Diversispora epigaea]